MWLENSVAGTEIFDNSSFLAPPAGSTWVKWKSRSGRACQRVCSNLIERNSCRCVGRPVYFDCDHQSEFYKFSKGQNFQKSQKNTAASHMCCRFEVVICLAWKCQPLETQFFDMTRQRIAITGFGFKKVRFTRFQTGARFTRSETMKLLKCTLLAAMVLTVASVAPADDKPLLKRFSSFSWMKKSPDKNEPRRMVVLTQKARPIRMVQATLPPEVPPAPAGETPMAVPAPAPMQTVPMPEEYHEYPMPVESGPPPASYSAANTVPLYHCVKYEDLHNIHPCAVTKVIAVLDPCEADCKKSSCFLFGSRKSHDHCGCGQQSCNSCNCGRKYVYIQICVPPCECVKVKTSRDERKVKYDYGKYEVEIKSKNGVVYVDYDD